MFATNKWILFVVCLCLATIGMAQEATLLSPLKGEDSVQEEKSPSKGDLEGLEAGMELTSELQATNKGEVNFVNLLRLNAKMPISNSLSFETASISTCETAAESIGGDLQSFSNIEAGNVLFAISKLGLDWQIEERQSLFVGVRNMNEDYFASPVTAFFSNSSCGIYPTIAANYSIANYPLASMGVHYSYETEPIKVQASLYNGTGYNRFSGRENVFRVCPKSDGVFGLAQVEFQSKGSYYFLGNSVYCNEGVCVTPWTYAEQRVNDRLKVIAGLSHAFTDNPACKDFVGLGAHYESGKCEFGVFTDYANFAESEEWATELTCKYAINDNISLQPVTHFIFTGSQFKGIACLRLSVSY